MATGLDHSEILCDTINELVDVLEDGDLLEAVIGDIEDPLDQGQFETADR
ncbi:hypothetical protein [Natrinema amylolyticum]|nr:hypothetical protein [Natrinema amylolyticum]